MGAVVIELLFKVIHIEALAEGTGDPFVVFCAFKEAGHAADALQDGAFKEQCAEADDVPAILVAGDDSLKAIAHHVAPFFLRDVFMEGGKVGTH